MTDLTVRRRAGLVGLLTAGSLAFAAAYGWVYLRSHDGRALAVAAVLAAVGLLQAWELSKARQPMLVADERGVRIRLGARWIGLTWADVERAEVSERGLIRDGRVAVVARNLGSALADAGPRARASAWLNRRMYGEALVVPYGLTTTISVVDPAAAIDRLAGGAVLVVRSGDLDSRRAEPAVVVTAANAVPADASDPPDPPDTSEEQRESSDVAVRPNVAAAATESARRLTTAAMKPTERSIERPSERPGERPGERSGERPSVERPAARREEVTVAGRMSFGIVGDLALANDAQAPTALPEIEQLRRTPTPGRPPSGVDSVDVDSTGRVDNVSLIIDATTDLSARAMRKVRRAQARQGTEDDEAATPAETPWTTVIGDRIRGARLRAGLDVDELAERTRIRAYVIESIEADDFTPCGGDFYARGHLRTLARYLNTDAEALVADYDATFATSPVSPRQVFEVELATGGPRLVRGGDRSPNWAAIVAAVLVIALIWGIAKFITDGGGQPGELSPPTRTATGLGSPGPGNPPVTGPVMAQVKVSVGAADTRVVVRDRFKQILFDGVIAAGASKKFQGESPLRVMAADGGDVSLSVKGRQLGVMGDPGVRARERVSGTKIRRSARSDVSAVGP